MVLSVLIMSIMGIIVFGLSSVVINNIVLSRHYDHAMRAYYGAESSIEQALYEARKLDRVLLEDSGELPNGVNWVRQIDATQDYAFFVEIPKDKFIQLDLFDVDDPACLSENTTGVVCDWESMNITWEGTGSLQATLTSWDTGNVIDYDPESFEEVQYISASSPWVLNDLEAQKNYRLKLKAIVDDVQNVQIQLFDQDNTVGDIVQIPNFLTLYGRGTYGQNRQALQVSIPRKAPLSSLYDFVIFSEDDIVKELE